MTRSDILNSYNVVNGIIRSPGKFEGEALYIPYFWEAFLNGFADHDDGNILRFDIVAEDKELFPELKHKKVVRLIEDSSGFVREV